MTMPLTVHVVPVLSDNYAFLIEGAGGGVLIDPGEAGPCLAVIDRIGCRLTHILITHYEADHVAGIDALVRRHSPCVIGPAPTCGYAIDRICTTGDRIEAGGVVLRVIDTPGHFIPHVAYYEERVGWLFSGDSLFGAGCGRVRDHAYAAMFESLRTLAALPRETRVYFGHEYTASNLAFAASVEPDNPDIEVRRLGLGPVSCPSTIGEELDTNPFLRCSCPSIRRHLGLLDAPESEVFRALRLAKNRFPG